MKRVRSISWRLAIRFSAVCFFGLVLFGVAMWFHLEQTLTRNRERTLERRADRLIETLRRTAGEPEEQRRKFQAFAAATGGGLIEVFRPDGSRALPSPGAEALQFPWPQPHLSQTERFSEANSAGQPYLVMERTWNSPGGVLVLCVAAPLEANIALLRSFRDGMFWAVPALLALSAFGGYLLSRRALRPVDAITAAARSISAENLAERLPVPATDDELQRLSETCNEMLSRLDMAVAEIKRFTTDASHELRTPLSVIRTVAELAQRNLGADPESRRAFGEVVEEAARTSRLLEEMLLLARADDGTAQLNFEPVDLAEVVRVVAGKARLIAERAGHQLHVDFGDLGLSVVNGDYSGLQRLLWILLDNAFKFTPSPGVVRISLRERRDRLVLEVMDSGIGIPASDLPHIFKRFYRGRRLRSDMGGSGLGLAIANWIAETHRAELSVASAEGSGATFTLAVPRLESATEARLRGTLLLRRTVRTGADFV